MCNIEGVKDEQTILIHACKFATHNTVTVHNYIKIMHRYNIHVHALCNGVTKPIQIILLLWDRT